MKERKTRAYISGAVTGNENYMQQFETAEKRLQAAGYKVINPAKILKPLEGVCTYDELMKLCIELLDIADCIVMLDGWKQSRGANREYGYAAGMGIDTYEIYMFPELKEETNEGA
nr:MAG TPA: deoxyribosyltransferase [Bacteriophage sp.]